MGSNAISEGIARRKKQLARAAPELPPPASHPRIYLNADRISSPYKEFYHVIRLSRRSSYIDIEKLRVIWQRVCERFPDVELDLYHGLSVLTGWGFIGLDLDEQGRVLIGAPFHAIVIKDKCDYSRELVDVVFDR